MKTREKKSVRDKKPLVGGQIEVDELRALEAIRDREGVDRTTVSSLVRIAIVRMIQDDRAGKIDYREPMDDRRTAAGLK